MWNLVYANSAQDAVHLLARTDAHGAPFDGNAADYVLVFAERPPARHLWCLTAYACGTTAFVETPGRRSIGHMPEALRFDGAGGLTIRIQTESPADDDRANWLRAPSGPFELILRLFGPEGSFLDGRRRLPDVAPVPRG